MGHGSVSEKGFTIARQQLRRRIAAPAPPRNRHRPAFCPVLWYNDVSREEISMKQTNKLALVLAAGVAIGVAGGNAIRAQQVKVAPGYVVAELEVNDPTTFQKYGAAVPDTLAPFNGKYLVRGGKVTAS
jgi:uncharacterized protein DUF1330